MGQLVETSQPLKREDISDELVVVDAAKTPLFTSTTKGPSPNQTLFEQPVDKYDDPKVTGRPDGTDIASGDYEDAQENQDKLPARVQWFARFPVVGKIAGMVNVAGVGKGQSFAKAKVKKMVELKRDIEARTVSVLDSAADNGTDGSLTRGLGKWIQNGAQSNDAVPSAYRTPTANIIDVGTAASDITEQNLQDLGQALWEQTKEKVAYELPMTASAKARVTNFTRTSPENEGEMVLSRFNQDLSSTTLKRVIDIYEGDFASFHMYAHPFMSEAASNTLNQLAYAIRPDLMEYRVMQGPMEEELYNGGGGRKSQIDAILGLVYKNPLAAGKLVQH
jgi:hypothetical protein